MQSDPLGLHRTIIQAARLNQSVAPPEPFTVQITVSQIAGAYYGQLKVVRRADQRRLFPFEGAPTIGPFDLNSDARKAAHLMAQKVIADDLTNPET